MDNKNKEFYLVITDKELKLFNVVGPINDDNEWINKVNEHQDKNKKINCHSMKTKPNIEEISKQLKLKYTEKLIV
jgi:hypothetical protein